MRTTSATSSLCISSIFFFQAEDGIRDYKVTGVQTCALPILMTMTLSADHRAVDGATAAEFLRTLRRLLEEPGMKIGRASCREGGERGAGAVGWKKKDRAGDD